jgi:RNA polymerase sigma factor (sigma-70 family)
MNRVLNRIFDQLADLRTTADRELLDRFLGARDETAFAELVRRYGPAVWGVCRRRLAHTQDAEDAFQATFLVLLRRAAHLSGDAPLGPWLYRVAVLTARNLRRGNRRRAALGEPLEHEVPAREPEPALDKFDLDAALLALSERDRVPVVLCHLQGLSRREAAERLGCPEGTLSARLNRALAKLRARLGAGAPAVLATGAVMVPTQLAEATVRAATIYTTSIRTAAGVSPAVVGLTDGVIRMFWMKKVMTAAVLAVLVVGAGALALGTVGRSDSAARADEPTAAKAPPAAPEEADPLKRVEKRLADLEKQKVLLDATLADLKSEKQRLEVERKEKEAVAKATALGKDIDVIVGHPGQSFTVREVINGRVGQVECADLNVLTKYLSRAFKDPDGPKALRVAAFENHPADHLKDVFAACAAAGYTRATFRHNQYVTTVVDLTQDGTHLLRVENLFIESLFNSAPKPKPGEIDLTKYAPKKP